MASRQRASRKKWYLHRRAPRSFRSIPQRNSRLPTPIKDVKLGWIGTGRMGYEMAARLAKGGCDIALWNRTRAKAEPLAKYGAQVVDALPEPASRDIVFRMLSAREDVKEVMPTLLAAS